MTFATPTIISGDKFNLDVIAHELAHSWSGNLATAASWQNFWLNEVDGFSSVPYEAGFNFLYFLDRTVGRERWDKFILYVSTVFYALPFPWAKIEQYFTKYRGKSLNSADFRNTLSLAKAWESLRPLPPTAPTDSRFTPSPEDIEG